MKQIEKLLGSFLYWFDYVVGFVMTNPHRLPFYHRYMREKYGDRYCSKEVFDRYWRIHVMRDDFEY
jgi:hypothetical protein